jgi:hypothetical protein
VEGYTAFTMVPYVHSDELTYDVLWLGAYANGEAMGKGDTLYFSQGADIEAAFDAIVDCSMHSHYAEVNLREPQGPPPERNGIARFSDCTLRDGRTVEESIEALGAWSEYLAQNGSDTFAAILFALAGETSDADYTFKFVQGFGSMNDYGHYTDVVTRGGFRRADELMGRLMECDSPRIYLLERIRLADEGN